MSVASPETMTLGLKNRQDESFASLRKAAFLLATQQGLPTTAHEDYKYTPLASLAETAWRDRTDTSAALPNHASIGEFDQIQVVFQNGLLESQMSALPAGLSLLSLASSEGQALAESHLGKLANPGTQTFAVTAHLGKLEKPGLCTSAAINTATFADGVVIKIAKNSKIEQPIELVFVASGDNSAQAPRILVVLEEGAEATLIENYVTAGTETTLTNAVVEVYVAQNAKLEHIKFAQENTSAQHVALTEAELKQDATYRHFNITFGGAMVRNDINVFLDGSNTHLRMDGVTCINGNQHVDNHTRLDHAKPHCESFEIYKHLLGDDAVAVFNGKIFVHEDAQKTDAKQTNQAILLSPTAVMNSKPQLEIFADDVKCTHGATVGYLQQEPQFYLRSRGIPKELADALLLYTFAAEVLEQIEHEGVRQALIQRLFHKVGHEGFVHVEL